MSAKTDRELLEKAAKAAGVFLTPEQFAKESLSPWEPHMAPTFSTRKGCMTGYRTWYGSDGKEIGGWETFDWSPLTDDGDALRLAVKLKIDLSLWIWSDCAEAKTHIGAGRGIPLHGDYTPPVNNHREPNGADPYAAARRAIVRAAAEIGAQMINQEGGAA